MDKDTLFSSFGKWVAPLHSQIIFNWQCTSRLDSYVKKLDTLTFLLIFIEAQLNQRRGLRQIMNEVQNNTDFHQALGITSISASQLSRKNNKLDPEVLQAILCELMTQLHRLRSPTPARIGIVKIIDSTTMSLCPNKYKWATFRKSKAGVNLHLRVTFADPDHVYPDKAIVTSAKPADHTQMDVLIDETDATYLMDRGYLDYGKYDNYYSSGLRFVSRLENNAVIEEVEELPVAAGSKILRDMKVILGKDEKRMKHVLRMIETTDAKGNSVRIITNRFDLSADEIGDLYRSRWQIETFFRWVKQHLKLTRFYGTSEQAVINQIWICLIAYCLDLLVKLNLETKKSLSELVDILKTLLWKPWDHFIEAVTRPPSRTSKGRQKRAKENAI